MTATLLTARRLSQRDRLVRGYRLPRGRSPAERLRPFDARATPAVRRGGHGGRSLAERRSVSVLHELSGSVHDLQDARVSESGDRAAAGHRLKARKAEALVAAREDKAARRAVEVR